MSEMKAQGELAAKNILHLLGLCRISRSCKSGEDGCENAIRSGDAFLVLVAADASANTYKKFHDKCSFYEVPIIDLPFTREELGNAMGQSPRSSIAITNEGLAKKMASTINSINGEKE